MGTLFHFCCNVLILWGFHKIPRGQWFRHISSSIRASFKHEALWWSQKNVEQRSVTQSEGREKCWEAGWNLAHGFPSHPFWNPSLNTSAGALACLQLSSWVFCFPDSDGSCYHSSCGGDGRQLPVILSCHPYGGGTFPPPSPAAGCSYPMTGAGRMRGSHQLLFESIWESKAGKKQDRQMCPWWWERERWVAKKQVKWLVQKISEGVKGCCMHGWRVRKGRDSGQSRERDWGQGRREEKIVMVSGCEIIWVLSIFKEWRGIRGIYNDPFSVLYFLLSLLLELCVRNTKRHHLFIV